jgi:hypothetical protein
MAIKIQPYVEMLIDALENKGASRSGLPYNEEVLQYPPRYRELLERIRERKVDRPTIVSELKSLSELVLIAAGNNQRYRIQKIVEAIDIYFHKEYDSLS